MSANEHNNSALALAAAQGLRRIRATDLLAFTTEQLWGMLTGRFALLFDDDVVITNARETIYSSYGWEFHRRFPLTPLLSKHHVRKILGSRRMSSDTHLELLGECMWSVYDTYVALPEVIDPVAVNRDPLSEMIYRLTNRLYNELSYRCEPYVGSIDALDFVQILRHPRIKKANDEVQPTKESISASYDVTRDVLSNDPAMDRNPIALGVRSKIIKIDSVLQCVNARGFLTDTDSHIFPIPVLRGYAMGLRSFYNSFVESRSAAKSLTFSKAPLQQAEYFSRRLQLMCQIVRNLHPGDCGSQEYLLWTVRDRELNKYGHEIRKSDLGYLVGKIYMDDDGVLKIITEQDKHLIGRELKLRSVLHCAHPDPYGICATCFGELSLSVPENTNIGHMCCTSMTQKSSQSVLSVKHMDSSSAVGELKLGEDERRFLRVGPDENSYHLAEALKDKEITIIVPHALGEKLSDINDLTEQQFLELNIARITEFEEIHLRIDAGRTIENTHIEVMSDRRKASFTLEMLAYIRDNGMRLDNQNNYLIDMVDWKWHQPILRLPMKHFNMADHSREIAELLESNVEQKHNRDNIVVPDVLLWNFFNLVNSKLSVNLAVLEVTLYGAMIRSASHFDYALPKVGTRSAIGVMTESMAYRSLGATFAYENHREIITNPMSYLLTNRPDHPMDALVMPAQVLGYA